MSLKIKVPNVSTSLFFLTVLSMQEFAELIPTTLFVIPGLFKYSDIGIIASIVFFIWSYFGVKSKEKVNYTYAKYIVAFLIIMFISLVMPDYFFGQSIILGFRVKRKLIICFLLYFPVTRLLKTGQIGYKQLLKILFIVGTFELIVYTLQYLLVDIVTFTYIDTTEMRYNSTRLRVPYLLPLILGLKCLSDVMTGKVKKMRGIAMHTIYFVWAFFLLVIICKHRAPALILACTIGLAYVIWKKKLTVKILSGIIVFAILVLFVFNSTLVYQMFDSTMQGIFNSLTGDISLSIRQSGQAYHLQRLLQSPIFGFGPPHNNNSAAYYASGAAYGFYLIDNGIVGFMYVHGIIGVIWLVLLFIKSYRMSWNLYKKKISYLFILYFFFETANLYIGMHWYYSYTLPFVMVLVMLEYEYDKSRFL